jgi:hypothetical protein
MASSLQARVHDPLWLLARQWQFGEFQAEDAGSLVKAEINTDVSQLNRFWPARLDAIPAPDPQPYDCTRQPLETLVEREHAMSAGATNGRLAAEAGLHFLRLLGPALSARYHAMFLESFAMGRPSPDDRRRFDEDSLRFLNIMADRVIDGIKLYTTLAPLRLAGQPAALPAEAPFDAITNPSDRTAVIAATTAWLDWCETEANHSALISQPEGKSAWIPERMEYEFSVSAPMPSDPSAELVLVASEYSEGHLDWHAFDVASSVGEARPFTGTPTSVIPTPIHFRGMPAPRWWEFEDAHINFGAVEAAHEDLARLLLMEFTLIYSNDFFVIPIDLPVGSICRTDKLNVTNTFGEIIPIEPVSKVAGRGSPWRMFHLSPDRRSGTAEAPHLLFLPPVLGNSLEGQPIEEVLLLRDEMANMAWAVERVAESPSGQPFNRFEAYQEKRRRPEATREQVVNGLTTPRGGFLVYRLATSVPDYWFPLTPVQMPRPPLGVRPRAIGLERGSTVDPETQQINNPVGRILEPGKLLRLNEEEVPRAGARITRSHQYARWTDGSTHLWIGRRKGTGRGEGSSGLRFDVIEPES